MINPLSTPGAESRLAEAYSCLGRSLSISRLRSRCPWLRVPEELCHAGAAASFLVPRIGELFEGAFFGCFKRKPKGNQMENVGNPRETRGLGRFSCLENRTVVNVSFWDNSIWDLLKLQ